MSSDIQVVSVNVLDESVEEMVIGTGKLENDPLTYESGGVPRSVVLLISALYNRGISQHSPVETQPREIGTINSEGNLP